MHRIRWTDIQKKIAELVIQGKSYKELRDAGYGCENIELVIRAVRRGETPPTPPNFEIPAVPRGPRPGSNEPYDLPGPRKEEWNRVKSEACHNKYCLGKIDPSKCTNCDYCAEFEAGASGKAGSPLFGSDNLKGIRAHAIDLMGKIIKELEGMDLTPQNQHAVDLMKEIIEGLEPKPEEPFGPLKMSIPKKEIDEMFVLASRPIDITYKPGEELAMAQAAYRICTLRLERFADWLHPSRFGAVSSGTLLKNTFASHESCR